MQDGPQASPKCARSFLDSGGENFADVLKTIITGDETMVVYYDLLFQKDIHGV